MKKLILILMGLFLISLVSGGLGTFKQDGCVDIKTILNTSAVNISTINYPNSTIAVSNKAMTKNGLTFNYTYCNTNALGVYIYDYFDEDGNVYVNDFEITGNGRENPSGSVSVLFIILFIISAIGLIYIVLYNLGHFVKLDLDIIDVAINWGIYFGVIVVYLMQDFYMGNPDLHNWLVLLIEIGGITSVLVPIIAFILSVTLGGISRGKVQINSLRKWRFR